MVYDSGEAVGPQPINAETLAAQAKALSRLATDPAFLGLAKEIQYTPESERLAAATRLASIETLKKRGVQVPEQAVKLTMRYFENPTALVSGGIRIDAADSVVRESAFTMTVCLSIGDNPGASVSVGWQI